MAPRLILGFAVFALLLGLTSPATASSRATGPFVCVESHCRGYLAVPLDRSGKTPGQIELYVSEFVPDGTSKGSVFLLAGGPGQSSSYVWGQPDPLWAGYTQIVYDNRGTGQSSRVACGPFVGDDRRGDITRCNDQLGAQRAFYSTRDNAFDMDTIRRALGFDKVSVYGTSYGTKQALAYAQEYPAHVSRLLLDSTLLPAGPDVYDMEYGQSVPLGLKALCAKGACARATGDIAGDVAAVANALALQPAHGRSGVDKDTTPVVVDGYDIVALAISTDLSSTLSRLLPSALHAARDGRPAELERLWALATWGSRDEPDHTDVFSEPVFTATMCDDGEFPWPAGTPVAARQSFVDSALAALPSGSFGVFGPWLARNGFATTCQGWESTGLNTLASTGFPDVPVLIVSGDRDIRTPTANARAVAKLFPHASVLVVHRTGHSVLSSVECADHAVGIWLGGGTPLAECSDETDQRFVLPALPASVASARALPPGGKVGKTLAAVVATVDELYNYGQEADSLTYGDGSLDGLVSGSTDLDHLSAYSDVAGVSLTGKAPIFGRATFTVGGRGAAHGTLTFEETGPGGECSLDGKLGGKHVSTIC